MAPSILPDPPADSELARWVADGFRREPSHSNIVYFGSPDEQFVLIVQVDDPVQGYLVQVHAADRPDDAPPLGRTIVDDRDLALNVATHMAAAAEDLDALADDPVLGSETVDREDVARDTVDAPDEWDGDEDEWREALDEAFEKAEIPRSKGTLTTKTIDDRDYYYLQWREGDSVNSEYVAPVTPSN